MSLTETPVFYLSGNPFVCNCHLQWVKRLNNDLNKKASVSVASSSSSPVDSFPLVPDLDRVRCSVLDHSGAVEERTVSAVRDEHFLCTYESRCLPRCRCCDFLACDCQARCPRGCRCLRDAAWDENVAQCSAAGFQSVPGGVPVDATALYLDGNNLTELAPGALVGRSRLRHLSLNDSQVSSISNGSFAGLSDLQVLRLGHNKLRRLEGHEFSSLPSLRELHLQHNQLVWVAADAFKPLRHLSVLRLEGNLLISFPVWQLSSNRALLRLTLADNWWQCDCDFVRKFRMFVDGNADIVPDAARIACTSPPPSSRGGRLAGEDPEQCPGFLSGGGGSGGTIGITSLRPGGDDWLPTASLAVGLLASSLILAAALAVLLKLREGILVWLHAKHGIRLAPASCCSGASDRDVGSAKKATDDDDDEGVLFEALVLHCAKDDRFVRDEVSRRLEPAGYRLCLLHRDLAGIYTSEAFKSALEASSRVVVLFSKVLLVTDVTCCI